MVFKKLLSAIGVGGPSVETVLTNAVCQPGGQVHGTIHIIGGDVDSSIENISLALQTRVEVESGDNEYNTTMEFNRLVVHGAFQLLPKAQHSMPFVFPVPIETPITAVYGQHLHGMTLGLRTELSIAGAIDKGDLDPISVTPLPIQQAVLDAFLRLGFRFKKADLERGHIRGVHQRLPFYQEIEFYPSAQYGRAFNEVELTFVAGPQGVQLVIEVDKRGGLFHSGSDAEGHVRLDHNAWQHVDIAGQLDAWFRNVGRRRGLFS